MSGRVVIPVAVLIWIVFAGAFALSWSNSYTGDNSTYIPVPENTNVTFTVDFNQSTNVSWYLDSNLSFNQSNITNSSFVATFESGNHTVVANSTLGSVVWRVFAYTPLVINGWYNNITSDNATSLEIKLGNSVLFSVNRSGTVISEEWYVNSTQVANGSSFIFSPEEYGSYNITYRVVGANSTSTINWSVRVYLEVRDALNTTLRFYSPPRRIVSLAPSVTEMLFAVNMGNYLVGVDSYSDYPPQISTMNLTRVGGPYSGISTEAIVNLTPDLVVAAEINPIPVIDNLRNLNITVLATESKTLDDILNNLLLLGKIGNEEETATKLVENLSSRIQKVRDFSEKLDSRRKPKIFYVVWYPQLWTPGKGTYANDLIKLAGGINIAEDGNDWYIMNKETLISRDPDVIICSGMGGYGATICSQIRNDSVLSKMRAVRENKMYVVPDSNIVERPGPRIVDGLEFFYDVVRENLKPLPQPQSYSSGGSGGGYTPPMPARSEVFKEKVEDYSEVQKSISSFLSHRTAYTVEEESAVVPLLLSGKYPDIGFSKLTRKLKSGDIHSYAAKIALSRYFFAKEIVVARDDLPVDAYAALSLAKKRHIPVLFVSKNNLPEEVKDVLVKLKSKKVIIIGGNQAVNNDVEREIEKFSEVSRIAGETRVETSVEIARLSGAKEVIITGYNSSIKAAVLSYIYGVPVIYTSENRLEPVIEFIKEKKPKVLFVDVDEKVKKRILDAI